MSALAQSSEVSLIEFWVCVGNLLGFPRSIGKIYGLLFAREKGVTADDCVELLRISRSSAGQGLKFLVELGAIRQDFSALDRRDTFAVESDLGVLVANVIQRRMVPSVKELEMRIVEMRSLAKEDAKLTDRLDKLERWSTKAQPVIAMIEGMTHTRQE